MKGRKVDESISVRTIFFFFNKVVREVIHGEVTCELRWGSQPCDHLGKCPEQECILEKDEGLGWRPQRDLGEITEEVREAAKRPGPGELCFAWWEM